MKGKCPHSQKDSNSYAPRRPPRVWQISQTFCYIRTSQWPKPKSRWIYACVFHCLLQSLQPCLQWETWNIWDLLWFESLSLSWKSWRQMLLQKLRRHTGSSCQPQHFFSSAATGEGWGLEKSRRNSLGLVWPAWSQAPKHSLRGCITGCSVSATCDRTLPLAISYMYESFWKQAPVLG